jgi:hypothetical protein
MKTKALSSLAWRIIAKRPLPPVLDRYVNSPPHPQNALDILKGEWVSQLPRPFETLHAGTALLFDDARIEWAETELGGFEGQTILDLGPLEGGHPAMFERSGAKEILAIEGNTRAFLKCLVTKEVLGLKRVSYQCGDFMEFLRTNTKKFDIVNMSGVLYHQRNPAELTALVAKAADKIIMWTHYYDHEVISANPALRSRFSSSKSLEYDGFKYQVRRQNYRSAVHLPWFCGGNAPYSHWMSREDIIRCLKHFGFDDVRISFEDRLHLNGPSFNLVAIRTSG